MCHNDALNDCIKAGITDLIIAHDAVDRNCWRKENVYKWNVLIIAGKS